jgi:uncharacterized membrane protein YphA (DoxX/SURF4 family)
VTFRSSVLYALGLADRIPSSVLGLVIRLGIADIFWRSGQTKVSGWHVTDTTIQLFRPNWPPTSPRSRNISSPSSS